MQLKVASEEELVLLLARGELPPRVQEQARALLSTPLNWDLILEQVMTQEVYPLFYRNLEVLLEKQGVESSEQEAVNRRSKTAGQRSEARGQKAETGGPLSQRIDEACQKLQKLSR